MRHETIYQELNISYSKYTKLRNKYRFFAYLTDLLTLDHVMNLDAALIENLLVDLKEILRYNTVLRGLDLALFGGLSCFSLSNLQFIRNLAEATNRYQLHKWQYSNRGANNVNI